jgi:hypothetical protein
MELNISGKQISLVEPKVRHLGQVSIMVENFLETSGRRPNNIEVLGFFVEVLSSGACTTDNFLDADIAAFGEANRKLGSFLTQLG